MKSYIFLCIDSLCRIIFWFSSRSFVYGCFVLICLLGGLGRVARLFKRVLVHCVVSVFCRAKIWLHSSS